MSDVEQAPGAARSSEPSWPSVFGRSPTATLFEAARARAPSVELRFGFAPRDAAGTGGAARFIMPHDALHRAPPPKPMQALPPRPPQLRVAVRDALSPLRMRATSDAHDTPTPLRLRAPSDAQAQDEAFYTNPFFVPQRRTVP